MFANAGSNRSYREIGVGDGHHDLSHHGKNSEKQAGVHKINLFHARLFNQFLQRECSGGWWNAARSMTRTFIEHLQRELQEQKLSAEVADYGEPNPFPVVTLTCSEGVARRHREDA